MRRQVLAKLRATAARFFTETCLIEEEADSIGSFGQPVPMWMPVATNVPCRVITAGSQFTESAVEVGAQEQIVDRYRISAPYGTPFRTNQRVTVGELVYQVVGLVTDRTDETDTQAILVRAR